MNNKFNKIIITILLAQGVAMTATAADKVKISPVISAGKASFSANVAPNVWLTLDDSGSMGAFGSLFKKKCNRWGWCRDVSSGVGLVYGYVPYNKDVEYQQPVDHTGKKLPLPKNINRTYALGPYLDQGNTTYKDIFITYAQDKMGVNICYGTRCRGGATSINYKEVNITKAYKVLQESYGQNFRALVEDEDSCTKASDKKNCQIWKTYYSTRLLALKSGLALAMYNHKKSDFRMGYQTLYSWTKDRWDRWIKRTVFPPNDRGSITPNIKRIKSLPLKANSDKTLKEFYQWLFTITPDQGQKGTPTRGTISYLFKEIKDKATGVQAPIWREKPDKAYHKVKNPAYTCRRNHNIILTDGQWESNFLNMRSREKDVTYNLRGFQYGSTENSSLSVGRGVLTYGSSYNRAFTASRGNTNLADIAFRGWATDLDGVRSNNKAEDTGDAVMPVYRMLPDKDGNKIVYEANGKRDWHHFNDPATWQHINTHTIGFALDTTKYKNIRINPPKNKEEAKTLLTASDGLKKFIDGSKKWVRSRQYNIPQNLAVGDLARAAITGRGLHFNANSGEQITEAFDEIFQSFKDEGEPKEATTGAAGVAGSSQVAGNSYFSSRYDSKAFTGELVKFNFYSGSPDKEELDACFGKDKYDPKENKPLPKAGTVCTETAKSGDSDWNVAKLLTAKDWKKRKILTRAKVKDKDKHQVVDFKVDNLHKDQKKMLKDNFTTAISGNFNNDSERLKALFNYVQGDGKHEDKFRSRDDHDYSIGKGSKESDKGRNILGAIIRSSPVYVGVPNAYTTHLDKDKDAHKNYITLLEKYIENNKGGKKEMIFVGANDGMLHAFNANTGEEVFAYVPEAIFDKLPQTVDSGRKVSLVDGNIDIQLVNFGSNSSDDSNKDWQRVLVGGMGGGAKGLYSLNITAPDSGTPTAASVKDAKKGNWEVSAKQSDNVGNILAKPAVIQLADNTWAAVVGNGYNSKNNKAVLLVINLENGKIIQELTMPEKKGSDKNAITFSDSNKPNGLAPVRFLRYPNKARNKSNHYDRAYAGDLQGNLWVFDLTKSSKSGGITVVNEQPLFTTATDKNGNRQPITVAPLVVKHPWGYGALIHFGTGALFDIDDLSSKVTNSIYAIWDDWIPAKNSGLPTPRNTTVVQTDLNKVHMKEITVNKKEVRYLDTAKNKNTTWRLEGDDADKYRGWKVDLKAGERAWQSATITYGAGNSEAISYNLVRYDSAVVNACGGDDGGVQNIEMAFNPDDATRFLPSSGALDIDDDGELDKDDKVTVDVTVKNPDGTTKVVKKAVAATGQVTLGEIKYNASSQDIKRKDGSSSTSGGTTAQRSTCRFGRTTVVSSGGGTPSGVISERCSYFSSWKELK